MAHTYMRCVCLLAVPQPEQTVTSLSNSTSAVEGSSYRVLCSFRQINVSSATRVNKFAWLLGQQELTPGPNIVISSATGPDARNWWNSTIMFTSIVPSFTGLFVDFDFASLRFCRLKTIRKSWNDHAEQN